MKTSNPLAKKLLQNPYIPPIIASIGLLIIGEILTSGYISINNISSLLMTTAILSFAVIGQATVIISGNSGIDMSVGAIMSMTALLGPTVTFATGYSALPFMVLYSVFLGGVVGLLNGLGVQIIKIAPLVMTLIMSNVVNGFTLWATKGQPTILISDELQSISKTIFGPIRFLSLLVFVLLFIVEFLLLRNSKFGRRLVLTGNNTNAARLCGISVRLVTIAAYTISGMISGLGGLALVGYTGKAQMQMGRDYTLLSVAAVVIGGTKLSGGKGNFLGGALGALVLVLLTSILQTFNMPAGLRSFFQGLLLVIILMANSRAPKLRQ
jgi:ribose transport system permease protein